MKNIIRALLICLVIICTGCGKSVENRNEGASESGVSLLKKDMTFDQVILASECAINASFIKLHDKGTYVEYEFMVNEVLYGDVPDSTIYVFAMEGEATIQDTDYTYSTGADMYTENQSYTLILDKDESIFYDHDRYLLLSDTYIPVSEFDSSRFCDKKLSDIVDIKDNKELCDYLKDKKNNDIEIKDKNSKKDNSNNLQEMVDSADLILEVRIDSLAVEGIVQNSNTYNCTPIENIKGNDYPVRVDGTIKISLMKNMVNVGDTYVVMLDQIDETSTIYNQDSKNGVFSSDDTKSIEDIKSYLD